RASHTTPTVANRKVHEHFTLRRATRYRGFNVLSDFVQAQGIDRALAEAFGGDKAPWVTCSLPETLRHLLDGYLLGVERVWHFAELEQESLLRIKRDRERLPDYYPALSRPGAVRHAGRPEPAASGGRSLAATRPGRSALVHPRLRFDGRDPRSRRPHDGVRQLSTPLRNRG